MKKLISIIIISIMLIQPAMAAADISDLSAEKQMEFMNNSLSIQTEQNTYSYGSTIGNVWGNGVVTGTAFGNATTTTGWRPYLGPMEIDKGSFYQITNQGDLYDSYSKGMEKEKTYHIAGWSLLCASVIGGAAIALCGMMGYNQGWWRGNAVDVLYPALLGSGLSLMLVGGLSSVPLITWDYKDNVSVSFAVGVADMYNQRLAESLR